MDNPYVCVNADLAEFAEIAIRRQCEEYTRSGQHLNFLRWQAKHREILAAIANANSRLKIQAG